MTKRKILIASAVIASIIGIIAVMWIVKNGNSDKAIGTLTQNEPSLKENATSAKATEQASGSSQLTTDSISPAQVATNLPAEKTVATANPAKSAILNGDLHVTKPFDLAELRTAGVPVIIDFGADSCIPCKEMAPVLVSLHDELKGKAIIRFVDVWKYRELAEGIPLQVIPTQVFFDSNGKPFKPSEKLQIPMNQYAAKETNEHVFTTHEGGVTKEELLAILYEMGMKK